MKKNWLGIGVGLTVMMLLAVGCGNNTNEPDPEYDRLVGTTWQDQFGSSEWDADVFENMQTSIDVTDCSIENEMRERPDPNKGGRPDRPAFHPWQRLINALKLTPEQQASVKDLLAKFSSCTDEARNIMKDHQLEIIQRANQARADVIAQVRAGEITRKEALEKIRAINKDAREALRNSDVAKRVREMVKNCEDEFLASLDSVLTPEQKEILKKYLDHRNSDGPGRGPGPGKRG
ncbi:MAG: hypothetical protein D8M52_01015 [Chlorobi bacterium]|nr:MAG: hypothetical protein F9K28_00235 [Bacteroidota bacterium]KXK35785.1 MAG: hypothetical protein UZ06_CHB003000250 [Chlorobi bacterium OLB6]MBE2265252.1 hypothetical protein [Flavobacteriales bacterium]MBL1160285.1 hypothetical protein [Chlorobiota bacterium]MBW7853423.1 hypothetical protein [Candidatus Kapabacteria bacterium]MCC6330470.1 hypothetical protein [Ignavibacteria bacterium]